MYRCDKHRLPYGEGYSCPRCAASLRPPQETSALRWQLKQILAWLARLPVVTLRWLSLGLVLLATWGAYRVLRTEIVVGGDTRFAPSLECRAACAEGSEKRLRACQDEHCTTHGLDQLAACEGGCDTAHPRTRNVLDFSYAWGKPPEWPFVWAALAGNPDFAKCFEGQAGPVALRIRVNAAGIVEKVAFSTHGTLMAEQREVCMGSALRGQTLPASKGTYVYAATQLDLATADYGEVRGVLEKRAARAAEEEDAIASAKVGEALSLIKAAGSLRAERRALAEQVKQQAAKKREPAAYPTPDSSPPPYQYQSPQQPYEFTYPVEAPSRRPAATVHSESKRDNREYLRRVEADVEQMRQARIAEERMNRERVQRLNMQREYMDVVKRRLKEESTSED